MSARLPRAVIALGVVSLFTDLSSEMIYPLLPAFVAASLAGGARAVGVIEGVAETTASLLKLWSGALSDRLRRRKPLIVAGYGLASLARPLLGLAGSWPVVLVIRFADRVGKGLRSSPRDALLADATPLDRRGRAFGFHRAMDHGGAVIGPLVAAGLLALGYPLGTVFLLAAVPAAIAMLVLIVAVPEAARATPAATVRRWPEPPPRASRPLLVALGLFTLGHASDAFLLLRLGDAGLAASSIALAWSALHVVRVLASLLGGRLADRGPRRRLIALGWSGSALTFVGFALLTTPAALLAVFFASGLAIGITEPAEKAMIAEASVADRRGAAFGWFHMVSGAVALPGAIGFGALWEAASPAAAFAAAAALSLVAAALLLAWTGPAALAPA